MATLVEMGFSICDMVFLSGSFGLSFSDNELWSRISFVCTHIRTENHIWMYSRDLLACVFFAARFFLHGSFCPKLQRDFYNGVFWDSNATFQSWYNCITRLKQYCMRFLHLITPWFMNLLRAYYDLRKTTWKVLPGPNSASSSCKPLDLDNTWCSEDTEYASSCNL